MLLISLSVLVALVGEVVLQSEVPESLNVGTLETPLHIFSNKCIEDLGCFYTGPPFWHPPYRPISLPPDNEIRTRFFLHTRSNPDEPALLHLTREGVMDSGFDAGSATKIIIHGFIDRLVTENMLLAMKDELLMEGPYNVIYVDWSRSNHIPYAKAVANARVVGAQTARLIQLLMEHKGITPGSIHIIGHSLGGHIAGWAGERVKGLGRITGLDPAGPFFHHAPREVRLDDTDADFVDVIHTNGGDFMSGDYGIKEAIGHMDFYPNGGSSQPHCSIFHSSAHGISDDAEVYKSSHVCSHLRANRYFAKSVNNCTFMAVECESYEKYLSGECEGATVSVMGFAAQKIPDSGGSREFYLKLDEESLFCKK